MSAWSGGDERGRGEVEFTGPLDPRARRLELLPTTEASRGVISFPLTWSAT
jgi:hypothetical protein